MRATVASECPLSSNPIARRRRRSNSTAVPFGLMPPPIPQQRSLCITYATLNRLAAAVDRRWGISPSGAQGGAGYPPLGAPTRDAVAGAPRLPTLLPSACGLLETRSNGNALRDSADGKVK